jgi:CBS domain-containing protein
MKVSDLMTRDPACCAPDTSLREVGRLMVEHDCGEIPVCEHASSKRVRGVITDRDIVVRTVAQGRNPLELTAADAMTTPAVTVTPETDLDDCANLMEQRQIRRVPVVDGNGNIVGIVSQADIVRRARDRMAAELVREVSEDATRNLR